MKTTSDRIKEGMIIRELKQADLVSLTGISKGALSSYISGKYTPKQNNIYKIAKALNVNEAVSDIIDTEEISEDIAKTDEFFELQIHGDSMEPRIYDGDVVIVRQQDDAESGDIVIAVVNGNDATCKRLLKYAGGISLLSLNSKYEPMVFSEKDIIEKPVKIIGKVIELRGKL